MKGRLGTIAEVKWALDADKKDTLDGWVANLRIDIQQADRRDDEDKRFTTAEWVLDEHPDIVVRRHTWSKQETWQVFAIECSWPTIADAIKAIRGTGLSPDPNARDSRVA